MSRSGLSSIVVAMLAAVGLGLWLGAPESRDIPMPAETAARLDPATEPETATEAEPHVLFDAPVLPLAPLPAEDASMAAGSEPRALSGPVSIIVTVRVDGRPLEDVLRGRLQISLFSNPARAIATRDPVGSEFDASVGGADRFRDIGEFSTLRDWFDGDAEPGRRPGSFGVLKVPDEFPLHVSVLIGSGVLAHAALDAPREELVFEMTAAQLDAVLGSIRLRVTSAETGKPIEEGRIEFGLMDAVSAEADPKTGLIVERMPPGPATFEVQAPGYERTTLATRVPRGRSIDLRDIALHRARRVTGAVLRPDGQPAGDTFFWLVPVPSKLDALSLFEFDSIARDGRFDLMQAGPRQYLLVATDFANAAVLPIDMRQGDLRDLEVRMQPLTQLYVSLPTEPLATVRLRLWTKSGVPVSSWPDLITERTSTEWAVPLVPGDYVLAINSARYGQMTKALTVGAESTRLDLAELLK